MVNDSRRLYDPGNDPHISAIEVGVVLGHSFRNSRSETIFSRFFKTLSRFWCITMSVLDLGPDELRTKSSIG